MARSATILNSSLMGGPSWRWLEGKLPPELAVRFEHVHAHPKSRLEGLVKRPHLPRYRAAFELARGVAGGGADLLVTHHPLMTTLAELFCRPLGRDIPHLAFSFNFTELPGGARLRLMRDVLPAVDRFVTFSSMERELYAETFGIDPDRIDVLLWGVEAPELPADDSPPPGGEYICAVGGEGRDYALLMDAMRRLPDLRAIVVARPKNLDGLSIPGNVEVRTNIPVEEANQIMRHSRFMVLPLLHGRVPCGHVTLVHAMYLGCAIVVTDSTGVLDYVRDGDNGLLVPPGDVTALTDRIRALWDDPARAIELGERGRAFAEARCSEQTTIDYFVAYLDSVGLAPRTAESAVPASTSAAAAGTRPRSVPTT